MKQQTFSFLIYLLLIPFSPLFGDDFYFGYTDGFNIAGADFEKRGANYIAGGKFSFATPGIDGSVTAVSRAFNQFSLFYPVRIGTTNNFFVQRSNISFDDSSHTFTRSNVKNFRNFRLNQPNVFDFWDNASGQGFIFVRNNDLFGRKINIPAANPIGGNVVLLNTVSPTLVVTACVDPEGTYFAAVTFNQNGYFIIFRQLLNGRPTGNAVIYQLSGAVICLDCSRRQPNERIFIAFKEHRQLGNTHQTRPFLFHLNENFGLLGVRPITNWNTTTPEILFHETFNTIKLVEDDERAFLVIYGKKIGSVLAAFWRNINLGGSPNGPQRRLFASPRDSWGYDGIGQIGDDH